MTAASLPTDDWRAWPVGAKLRLLERLKQEAGESTRDARPQRDADTRRPFAGDPWKYMRDVLGVWLSPQQEETLGCFERHDHVLVPAGNNIGKTFLLAAYGIYRFDAVASLPSTSRDHAEQGAQVLLPGPDDATIFATIYQSMLELANAAESRGWRMPGVRSDRSVLWYVRPRWFIESFSPPRRVDQNVRHTASGRHHPNQVALIEEGQGVDEATWRAVEGMCSSLGNKVLSAYNPTEDVGPASARERDGSYRAIHLSALDHPNVVERRAVVPDAISYLVVDDRVRTECRDHGTWPAQQPDLNEGDFLYALPAVGAAESGGRLDGVRGHPSAAVHVYRPGGFFDPQVRGLYPRSSSSALCDPADWDAAVARWRSTPDHDAPPDRVGVDPARSPQGDDPCALPSWGEDAETLLRMHASVVRDGRDPRGRVPHVRCGAPVILQKGDGPDIAQQVAARWPNSPVNCDEGGVGTSSLDHARAVLRQDWMGVSFGSRPEWMDRPLPGEPFYENLRAVMYARAGRLVSLGLVDVAGDNELRKEFLAHYLLLRWRVVEVDDPKRGRVKERKPSMLLCEKDEIKKRVGHSPDRADAFVLSVFGGGARRKYEFTTMSPGRKHDVDDDGRRALRVGGRFGRGTW